MGEGKRDLKIVMFRTGGDVDAARQEVLRGCARQDLHMWVERWWNRNWSLVDDYDALLVTEVKGEGEAGTTPRQPKSE